MLLHPDPESMKQKDGLGRTIAAKNGGSGRRPILKNLLLRAI